MKYISASIVLVLWMVLSVFLAITVIGLAVALDEAWINVSKKLLDVFRDKTK